MLAARLMPVLAARRKLAVGLSAGSAAASAVGNGPFTTGSVTATPSGGVGPYTYAWARVSGDATISVSDAGAASVTWSASGSAPQTKGAIWQCTVTDAAGVVVVTGTVSVSVQFQVVAMSVNLSTTTASVSGPGNGPYDTNRVTATPSGGTGPYTYTWEFVSGDNSILISDGSGIPNPFWVGWGTAPQTKTCVWRCKVTDGVGTIAYSANVNISHAFTTPALSVSVNSTYAYGSYGYAPGGASTDTITATPSGGVGPYTYLWEKVSGDSGMFAANPNGNATAFVRTSSSSGSQQFTATWRCRVQDSLGTVAYSPTVDAVVELGFI